MIDRFNFRVWYKPENKYLDGIFAVARSGRLIIDLNILQDYDDKSYDCIIEQCTGLKDKNGKLIYEGDIVRLEIVDNDSVLGKTFERICEICFGKGDYPYSFVCKNKVYCRGYALLSTILGQEIESIEIIGNIHEQPEQKD